MSAVLKLMLTLLLTCGPWLMWLSVLFISPIVVLFVASGLEMPSGLSAAISISALWVIASALGFNLKQMRAQQLSRLLPNFQRNSLSAALVVLLALITLLATIHSWRAESVIGLFAAAALGLGVGLSVSLLWASLVFLALHLWQLWPNAEHLALWSSSWTAAIAPVWLAVGLWLFVNAKSRQRLTRKDRPSIPKFGEIKSLWSHQPYQFGKMINPLPVAIYPAVGLLVAVLSQRLTSLDDGLSSMVHAGNIGPIYSLVAIFGIVGVIICFSDLADLWESKRLRQLAILPTWSRLRLFQHVEVSYWRSMIVFLLAMTIVFLGLSLWAGGVGLWRLPCFLVVLAVFASINFYAALGLPRKLRKVFGWIPHMLLTWPFGIFLLSFLGFLDEPIWGALFAVLLPTLAVAILLSWRLRVRALTNLSSISFQRNA